ncbi:MAG: XRE family transcriptional regulator [Phycisphaerales bacterium]|nr:MAG: XRE family transcriptional regulator [Phycisphaerales bacterium]
MATCKTSKRKVKVTASDGNVFADLGVPNPEEALAKAELARRISEIVRARRLTQVQAARILGVDQAKVSQLVRGCLAGFSIGRLSRYLNALGRDVEIVVKDTPRSRREGRLTVTTGG